MKRDYIDFHEVADIHLAIHARLCNWARWVRVRPASSWTVSPMFRQYRSKAFQWHVPEIKDEIDTLDAQAMEKAVFHLPDPHRAAIRWNYVFASNPGGMARQLGLSSDGLMRMVSDGRTMLKNRAQA